VLVGSFVGWLVGHHLLLRDFWPYGLIFMNVCFVITVAMVMLQRHFGSYVFCLHGWGSFVVKIFWTLWDVLLQPLPW
jgi:hypothetical protein